MQIGDAVKVLSMLVQLELPPKGALGLVESAGQVAPFLKESGAVAIGSRLVRIAGDGLDILIVRFLLPESGSAGEERGRCQASQPTPGHQGNAAYAREWLVPCAQPLIREAEAHMGLIRFGAQSDRSLKIVAGLHELALTEA